MKKFFLSIFAVAVATGIFAVAQTTDDPVLMTVGGHDVKVSEFEYLYNKNNSQQIQPQTVDEYVDLFVDYKLKVADAEKAGIDTTASFLAEYNKFRNELAAPYLRDKALESKLMQEAYEHLLKDYNVSHIMIAVDRSTAKDAKAYAHLDSIRNAIIAGATTFEDAAAKYSIDQPTAEQGGLMGWITSGSFPWPFEKAAYATKKGEISPVIDSGFGLHIIKVNDIRDARGEVNAAHILKLTRDVPAEQIAGQKAAIDSIYELLVAGADFADLARRESQDPGSAQRGGDLGWFGSGMMVAEFDSVAFAMADGEISKPFTTQFGYHIIKKNGHRSVGSLEEATPKIKNFMSRDGRDDEPRKARIAQLSKKYGALLMKANLMGLQHRLSVMPLDSTTYATLETDSLPAVKMGDKEVTIGQAFKALNSKSFRSGQELYAEIEKSVQEQLDALVTEKAIEELAEENTDYRNLINEYRDGILLFDISNKNVWDRAAKDKEGVEKYFKANAKKYAYDAPRFKGFIVFASTDSVLTEAKAYAETIENQEPEAFVSEMRRHFGKNIKIERVIAAKGENPITDYLAFGAEKPGTKSNRWAFFAALRGKIINAPEEAADVRGAATTDYQALLEKEWVKALHKKYPVKINKKVLKSLK